MAGKPKQPLETRFMGKVDKQENGCWLWTGYKMPKGYGMFRFADGHKLAHRVSYSLFVGELDAEKEVMHKCDNPSCVNPKHLLLGTHLQNMQDAKQKARNAYGERHGRSVLTEEMVKRIKQSMGRTQKEIGKDFGVSQTTVWEIKTGRKWAHVSI
jgi:DNA-binding XRE family transcriptional regulator